MMYSVAVAICAVAIATHDCDRDSATEWVPLPVQTSDFVDCFGDGTVATIDLLIPGSTYQKVFCTPTSTDAPPMAEGQDGASLDGTIAP
jgi:hypothetical protein